MSAQALASHLISSRHRRQVSRRGRQGRQTPQDLTRHLFGYRVDGRLRVAGGQEGEAARIHDPQVRDPVDPHVRIDDGARVRRPAHLARGRRVPQRGEAGADEAEDVGVALDGGAGDLLGSGGQVGEGASLPELALAPERGDGELDVDGVREPVRVDDGGVRHARAVDRDVAAAQGRDDRRGDGGVVAAVHRVLRLVVPLEAQGAADGQVLELGPVGGEGGVQGVTGGFGEVVPVERGQFFPAEDAGPGDGEGTGGALLIRLDGGLGEGVAVQSGGVGGHVDGVGGAEVGLVV